MPVKSAWRALAVALPLFEILENISRRSSGNSISPLPPHRGQVIFFSFFIMREFNKNIYESQVKKEKATP